MKHLLLTLIFCWAVQGACAHALDDMARRLFGERADEFVFVETTDTVEYYAVSAMPDRRIRVEGATPSAMAVGLNRYLRELCGTDVSWNLCQPIVLPAQLPLPENELRGKALDDMRFFLNYCTYGYSMPFWGMADWERLIDWMALNGVNMPLATAGQEAVWQRVWRSYGIDDDSIRSYFTGPAHLPWHRMVNADRWNGPLPQSYIDGQAGLQRRLLERCRTLGMKPVMPAFAGHVPPQLAQVRPDVKIDQMVKWGGLSEDYRSYLLDPSEPLFDSIQRQFISEQTAMFGTDHIYGLDPYNEMVVPSMAEDYLYNASKHVYEGLAAADSAAIWMQMGWNFYNSPRAWTKPRIKAYLSGVPQGRLVILDYYIDKVPVWPLTDAFNGHDFILCYLGNFGGNSFLVGDMDVVRQRADSARRAHLPNLRGVGGTLEGLDLNRQMHAWHLDAAWEHDGGPSDADEWITVWAKSRGAGSDSAVARAWLDLSHDIYRTYSTSQATPVNTRPCLEGSYGWTTRFEPCYPNDRLVAIWKNLIDADADCYAHDYDLVNVGRQALGNHFGELRRHFTQAYRTGDTGRMTAVADSMDMLIADLDLLLAAVPDFSMAKWLADARSWGVDQAEADYYESNARRIVTTWTQAPGGLNDYASRDLAGLTGSFYRERWRRFTSELIDRVARGLEFEDKKDPFYKSLMQWETDWVQQRLPISCPPVTDARTTARTLYDRYFGRR